MRKICLLLLLFFQLSSGSLNALSDTQAKVLKYVGSFCAVGLITAAYYKRALLHHRWYAYRSGITPQENHCHRCGQMIEPLRPFNGVVDPQCPGRRYRCGYWTCSECLEQDKTLIFMPGGYYFTYFKCFTCGK